MSDLESTAGAVSRPDDYEFRARGVGRIELRARRDTNAEGDQGAPVLFGAIPYGRQSEPLGYFDRFIEVIEPGFASASIEEDNIVGLFNHVDDNLLARSNPTLAVDDRTLRFADTDDALTYEMFLDETVELDRMVANRVERGILEGNSFGFTTVRDSWDYSDEENGNVVRTLAEVRLFDVGPVTFPAYPDSENELRSFIPGNVEQKIRGMLGARKAAARAVERRLDAIRLRELESGLTVADIG